MASKKKQREDFKQEDVLQAVVIADSFNVRFAPLTKNKPRSLLPLVNVALLDYTLEFLSSAGIEHIIVFCCVHADQIKKHLNASKWKSETSSCDVTVITNEGCLSVGDALREIDAQSIIKSDFVLVNGDIVSNMQLKPLLQEHKQRRLKEKTPIMTMVMKRAPPGQRTRCREEEVILAVANKKDRILHYQKVGSAKKFDFPLTLFQEHTDIDLRYDLLDCHVSVCSPQVPQIFTDEFDYLTRDDFVRGILVNEEIFGNTIHLHVIEDEYAARVSNLHMYDAVSKDVMSRWTYPMVADMMGQSANHCTYCRNNIYLGKDVSLERDCILEENVVIGRGSTIGNNTHIVNTVIGANCHIGDNVDLDGAYIWNNVSIDDSCVVKTAVLDTDVHVYRNTSIQPGCVLASKVKVGPDVVLPPGTLLQSEPPSGDLDEFDGGVAQVDEEQQVQIDPDLVGTEGHGYPYSARVADDSDDDDDLDALVQDVWGLTLVSDLEDGESDLDTEDEDNRSMPSSPPPDDTKMFYDEVMGTLQRALEENIGLDNMVLEINSLKHAYNIQIREVNVFVTKAVVEFPLRNNAMIEPPQYLGQFKRLLVKLLPLLKNYIKSEGSQRDCIGSLEDVCVEHRVVSVALVKILHMLYEHDILSEDVILQWHKYVTASDDVPQRNKIRRQVSAFISWLEEAEEESDESD